MWRYLVGMAAGILLVAGGVLLWRNTADAGQVTLPEAPQTAVAADAVEDVPPPPQASEKTREERRFSRYDRDKDGAVSRDEYLAQRRKNFAKLDVNGDGRLSFDEYAVSGIQRFAKADTDKSGSLAPAEFLSTRIARSTRTSVRCPPSDREG
jgi:hypothetical protein